MGFIFFDTPSRTGKVGYQTDYPKANATVNVTLTCLNDKLRHYDIYEHH